MDDIKRILVLSRLTKHCKKAVDKGIFLADKCGAELYVFHVIHNPFGLKGWNLPIQSLEEEFKRQQEEARRDIDQLVADKKPAGMSVNIILKEGNPNQELFKFINEQKIDLVIFVTHSEWRMEHFLFGRSNEEIIRELPCSIMMVKDEPHAVNF